MAPIDEEELRRIFKQFDTDGSGSIDHEELGNAMQVLGVKCSKNSAKKVLASIDTDQNGTVEWEEFFAFFNKVGDPDEVRKLLSEANGRFLDYKDLVKTDPNFSKRFAIPPSLDPLAHLTDHPDSVESVEWVSDTRFLTASIDGVVNFYELGAVRGTKPALTKKIDAGPGVYTTSVFKDAKRMLIGGSGGMALWDLDNFEVTEKFTGHTSAIYACKFGPMGFYSLSGAKNGDICFHDLGRAAPVCQWKGHDNVVYCVDFNPVDDGLVCSASADGTIKTWDIRSMSACTIKTTLKDAAASGVVFQAYWRSEFEIISGGDDYCMKRFDVRKANYGPVSCYFGHTSDIRAIALSGDGSQFVTGTVDGSMRVWPSNELGRITDRLEEVGQQRAKLEMSLDTLQDEVSAGNKEVEVLHAPRKELEELEKEEALMTTARRERETLACVQAKVALDGHKHMISSLHWRDPVGSDKVRILSGSHDQTAKLFELDRSNLMKIELWSSDSV